MSKFEYVPREGKLGLHEWSLAMGYERARDRFNRYMVWLQSCYHQDLEPNRRYSRYGTDDEEESIMEIWISDQTGEYTDNGSGSDEALNRSFVHVPVQERFKNYREWIESYPLMGTACRYCYSDYESTKGFSWPEPERYSLFTDQIWKTNLRRTDTFAFNELLNRPLWYGRAEERFGVDDKESFSVFSDQDEENGFTRSQYLCRVFGPPQIPVVGIYNSDIFLNRPEEEWFSRFRKDQEGTEPRRKPMDCWSEERLSGFLGEQETARYEGHNAVECSGNGCEGSNEVKLEEKQKEDEKRVKVVDRKEVGEDQNGKIFAKIDPKAWDIGRFLKQQKRLSRRTKRCRSNRISFPVKICLGV